MEHVKAGIWPLTVMRVVFLVMLLAVVAVHGGTQKATMGMLESALLWVVGAYLMARLLAGHEGLPLKSPVLWLGGGLLGLGWAAALLPESAYAREFRAFLPLDGGSWWPWASVDGDLSKRTMIRLTGLVGAMAVMADMGNSGKWRMRLWHTVVALGVAVAILGLLQRGMGDVGEYWGGRKKLGSAFGPFWYHGNAGAFLNLCWPLAAAGLMMAVGRLNASSVASQLRLAMWVLALMVMATGAFINVSKAAQGIFLLQAVALVWVWLKQWHLSRGTASFKGAQWLTLVVFLVLVGLLLYLLGVQRGIDRWEDLAERDFNDGRWTMATLLLPWTGEAGALGFGPGTFSAVYVVKSTGMSGALGGFWLFAHNDYVQALLEWGWLGASLWVIMGISTLFILAGKMREAFGTQHMTTFTFGGAMFISLAGTAVHAVMDFPMQIFAIQLVAVSFAGLALADWHGSKRTTERTRSGKRKHVKMKMDSLSGV